MIEITAIFLSIFLTLISIACIFGFILVLQFLYEVFYNMRDKRRDKHDKKDITKSKRSIKNKL